MTNPMEAHYNPNAWHRIGRGRERQFYATDAEIARFLTEGLPSSMRPYHLLGVEVSRERLDPTHRLIRYEVDEVVACCARSGGHGAWIVSSTLTSVDGWTGDGLQPTAAVNGLILVEHGFSPRGRQEASRIAIVDRIQNVETGAGHIHAHYLAIFRSLDRHIRRSLRWSSVRRLRDQTEDEDSRVVLMTDEAARAATREPDAWAVRPGREI